MGVLGWLTGAVLISALTLCGAYLGAWWALRLRLPLGVMRDLEREAERSEESEVLVVDRETMDAVAEARSARRRCPGLRVIGGGE